MDGFDALNSLLFGDGQKAQIKVEKPSIVKSDPVLEIPWALAYWHDKLKRFMSYEEWKLRMAADIFDEQRRKNGKRANGSGYREKQIEEHLTCRGIPISGSD